MLTPALAQGMYFMVPDRKPGTIADKIQVGTAGADVYSTTRNIVYRKHNEEDVDFGSMVVVTQASVMFTVFNDGLDPNFQPPTHDGVFTDAFGQAWSIVKVKGIIMDTAFQMECVKQF